VLHDRFLAPQALAHNNFVVIGRREGIAFGPEKVWTGSTNWTDQAWIHWFVDSRIEPVCLTYEALSREPKGALEIILSALDLDPAVAAAIEPKTTKMIDFESQNWASRFRAETDTLCPSDLLGNIP
jgi:LPS sulfotransferase NodH